MLLSVENAATPPGNEYVVGVAVAVPVVLVLNVLLLFVLIKRRGSIIKRSSASSSASGKTSLNGGDSKNSASEGNFLVAGHYFMSLFNLSVTRLHTFYQSCEKWSKWKIFPLSNSPKSKSHQNLKFCLLE